MSVIDGRELVDVVSADRKALYCWPASSNPLPSDVAGAPLPPRSAATVRGEVVCGCRDALALALRAKLLSRERVIDLLYEIDRSFDAGLMALDDVDPD